MADANPEANTEAGVDLSDFASAVSAVSNLSIRFENMFGQRSSDSYAKKEREMIPQSAILTADQDEAQQMRDLYSEVPKLTKKEKNLLALYDAIASGDKVVVLDKILKDGGMFGESRSGWGAVGAPTIAIAPVGAEKVSWVARQTNRSSMSTAGKARFVSWVGPTRHIIERRGDVHARWMSGETSVPTIPPQHRDKVEKGDLILWEATWRNTEIRVDRHPDPAILRKVSDGLYRVVAAWDLTAVEAAMLAG